MCSPSIADAQDPPPRIGPFVFDLHATVPQFPSDDLQLANSRQLDPGELPGGGLGLHGGAHLYIFSWKALTVGVGVDATVARARHGATRISDTLVARPVTETFYHAAPQLSFNFGDGDGWSYLSAGLGPSLWKLTLDGQLPIDADFERLRTLNYGGGARWFIKPHVAFSLDVRLYAIDPGSPHPITGAGSPRITLLMIGAGVSLK